MIGAAVKGMKAAKTAKAAKTVGAKKIAFQKMSMKKAMAIAKKKGWTQAELKERLALYKKGLLAEPDNLAFPLDNLKRATYAQVVARHAANPIKVKMMAKKAEMIYRKYGVNAKSQAMVAKIIKNSI